MKVYLVRHGKALTKDVDPERSSIDGNMRRWRHVVQIELGQELDVANDAGEVMLHPLYFMRVELQPRELRDVQHIRSVDGHGFSVGPNPEGDRALKTTGPAERSFGERPDQ